MTYILALVCVIRIPLPTTIACQALMLIRCVVRWSIGHPDLWSWTNVSHCPDVEVAEKQVSAAFGVVKVFKRKVVSSS